MPGIVANADTATKTTIAENAHTQLDDYSTNYNSEVSASVAKDLEALDTVTGRASTAKDYLLQCCHKRMRER